MIYKRVTKVVSNLMEWVVCSFDKPVKRTADASFQKSILILKLDAIGDYILFRNFLNEIKNSKKYSGYKIILAGNSIYKDIAETYDKNTVDSFVWLNTKKLQKDRYYRNEMIQQLSAFQAEILFHPTFSRLYFSDHLVKSISAKTKIGAEGNTRNIISVLKWFSDKYYNTQIKTEQGLFFEFDINKAIVESFSDQIINLTKPILQKAQTAIHYDFNYAVLFPDAAADYRRWSADNFSKVANYLIQKFKLKIIICGMNPDIAKEIITKSNAEEIIDLTRKTSLPQLAELIRGSKLLVANDTGAAHIGVAVDVKVLCISNGNHFGRFVPYPETCYKYIHTLLPPKIKVNSDNLSTVVKKYKNGSFIDINNINIDAAYIEIEKVLS